MDFFLRSFTILLTLSFGLAAAHEDDSLVVASLLLDPFVMETYAENSTRVIGYEGYMIDLLEELSKVTDLHFTWLVRDKQLFGLKSTNGTWNGLIGDIISGVANLTAAPLTPTSSRRKVVQFSTPFMSFAHVITMRRPQASAMTLSERLQRLFSPLSQGIWLMSMLAWLVTSAVLYIICHTNPYEWRRMARDKEATLREGEAFTCLNTFWFTISTLLWQGYTRGPRSLGGRTVVVFWWGYVLLFIAMYIASMTNFLRVGPAQDQMNFHDIQTMEDLARQDSVKYGTLNGGSTMQKLESMKRKSPNLRDFMKSIYKFSVPSIQSGVQRVRDSRKPFAFIAESAMAQYYARQSPCDIYMVGEFNTFGSYALALPLDSNLTYTIDTGLLLLRETGVLKRLFDRWFTGECTEFLMDASYRARVKIPPFIKVDLGSFSGALVILGIGLVLGSLITVAEVVIFKHAEAEERREKDEQCQPFNINDSSPLRGEPDSVKMEPITDV